VPGETVEVEQFRDPLVAEGDAGSLSEKGREAWGGPASEGEAELARVAVRESDEELEVGGIGQGRPSLTWEVMEPGPAVRAPTSPDAVNGTRGDAYNVSDGTRAETVVAEQKHRSAKRRASTGLLAQHAL